MKTVRYFHYFVHEDDYHRPIPSFMAGVVEAEKGPELKRSRSSDREPLNWLPRLKFLPMASFWLLRASLFLKIIFSVLYVPLVCCLFPLGLA